MPHHADPDSGWLPLSELKKKHLDVFFPGLLTGCCIIYIRFIVFNYSLNDNTNFEIRFVFGMGDTFHLVIAAKTKLFEALSEIESMLRHS